MIYIFDFRYFWRGVVMVILMFVLLGVQPAQAQNVTESSMVRNSVDYPAVGENFETWWLIPIVTIPLALWFISQIRLPKSTNITKQSFTDYDLAFHQDIRPRKRKKIGSSV